MKVWRGALWGFAVTVAWARIGSLVQQAPAGVRNRTNPLAADAQARRAGAKLYARECQSCHGPKREGIGKAPPLDSADVYRAAPGALFWVLRHGSLHQGMPSFAHLPELERWQVITFLLEVKETSAATR